MSHIPIDHSTTVLLSREVLLEKKEHKTNTERQKWTNDNHIMLYRPNVAIGTSVSHSSGYSIVDVGTIAMNIPNSAFGGQYHNVPGRANIESTNLLIPKQRQTGATGIIGHASFNSLGQTKYSITTTTTIATTTTTSVCSGYASVSGGHSNSATGFASIHAGSNNVAIGHYSISVGRRNTCSSWRTVTQEEYNRIGKLGNKRWSFPN